MDEFDEFADYLPAPVEEAKPKRKKNWIVISVASVCAVLVMFVSGVLTFRAINGTTTASPSPTANYSDDPALYEQPKDMESVINTVLEGTVTVYCGTGSGTGWGIDLPDDPNDPADDEYPYKFVTNHHVIDECVKGGVITFAFGEGQTKRIAKLKTYDDGFARDVSYGDFAILMTAEKVSTLKMAQGAPKVGHWVMAVGTPGSTIVGEELVENATFGRVSKYDHYYGLIVTDAAINHGNSGGPLVNSKGDVIGINTWGEAKSETDNISYAIGLPLLCGKVIDCEPNDPILWDYLD